MQSRLHFFGFLILSSFTETGRFSFAQIDDGYGWAESVTESCDDQIESLSDAVRHGDLSQAREIAQLQLQPRCRQKAARAFRELVDLQDLSSIDQHFRLSSADHPRPSAKRDDQKACWNSREIDFTIDLWDNCCSTLVEYTQSHSKKVECWDDSGAHLCCELHVGSVSHLRLPALQELAVQMRIYLDSGEVVPISLEQDGFLRQFDVSTVLWPAGYFLSLCVASPRQCGLLELYDAIENQSHAGPTAIELGTGIGAASISMALNFKKSIRNMRKFHPVVVATDRQPQALALTLANRNFNYVSDSVLVDEVDHFNVSELSALTQRYFSGTNGKRRGFSMVFGSSLLSFFDGTSEPHAPLWKALDILLDPNNPRALAFFAHTVEEPVRPPLDQSFQLVRQISGDIFGIRTRSSASSDFEISVFRRSDRGLNALEAEL